MDIDIDIPKNLDILKIFPCSTRASIVENGILKPHVVGFHFQNIPVDPISGVSAIPHKQAEENGFLKIDFLHLSLLDNIKSTEQLDELVNKEPDWDLLLDASKVQHLFHIKKHYDIIKKIQPRSLEDLADILALIRPNKISLLADYMKDKAKTRVMLYEKVEASDLRKSHALAYALNIVVQLNMGEING